MGAVLLLMTIGGSLLAAILLALSIWKRIGWLRNFMLGAAALWYGFYIVAFWLSSNFSEEKTLALNEPKAFCGFYFGCRLAARVTGVRRSKTFGALRAKSEFLIVRVKVSSSAERALLGLTQPRLTVIDAQGRSFEPTVDLTVTREFPPFEEEVPAGGGFEEEAAFDLPGDARNPRLDIREGGGLDRAVEAVLIGDEDSLGHKRNYFGLEQQNQAGGVK